MLLVACLSGSVTFDLPPRLKQDRHLIQAMVLGDSHEVRVAFSLQYQSPWARRGTHWPE